MADMMTNDPNRDTRERVKKLHGNGLSVREIAKVLNVSTQRVYQHLRALAVDAMPDESEAS